MSSVPGLYHLSFGSTGYLWLLLVVPLLFLAAWLLRRRRARYAVAYTNLDVLSGVVARRRLPWRRRVPLVLLALAVAATAAALARPHIELRSARRSTLIVLLVDVSGSMQATDVPPSRLGAAVEAMHSFVAELPKSAEVGLIAISDKPEVVDAPTTDHNAINSGLDVLTPQGGTALGDAVDEAVRVVVSTLAGQGTPPTHGYLPAAIVLATDGGQDRGTTAIQAAGTFAKNAGVRIYGITVGTDNGVISKGPGLIREEFQVPVEPGTVALLARETGGQGFTAVTAPSLDKIYRQLGTSIAYSPRQVEITWWFELAAALLLLAGVAALRLQAAALP